MPMGRLPGPAAGRLRARGQRRARPICGGRDEAGGLRGAQRGRRGAQRRCVRIQDAQHGAQAAAAVVSGRYRQHRPAHRPRCVLKYARMQARRRIAGRRQRLDPSRRGGLRSAQALVQLAGARLQARTSAANRRAAQRPGRPAARRPRRPTGAAARPRPTRRRRPPGRWPPAAPRQTCPPRRETWRGRQTVCLSCLARCACDPVRTHQAGRSCAAWHMGLQCGAVPSRQRFGL